MPPERKKSLSARWKYGIPVSPMAGDTPAFPVGRTHRSPNAESGCPRQLCTYLFRSVAHSLKVAGSGNTSTSLSIRVISRYLTSGTPLPTTLRSLTCPTKLWANPRAPSRNLDQYRYVSEIYVYLILRVSVGFFSVALCLQL